ncbi:MAG: alpha/beta hydrolase [Caulobacteraceae bacterium]
MGRPISASLAAFLLLTGDAAMAAPMTYAQYSERSQPHAEVLAAYGDGPSQYVEVWLPDGDGPHPVVIIIPGGCWTASVANLSIMNELSDDLRKRGVAVWNIEYRGVDQPGGGYPGTFQDVGAAIDLLREKAELYHLNMDRVVAAGHSAGGHLALWAAARANIPASSPLHAENPQKIDAVVSIAGLADLEAMMAPGSQGCGPEPVAAMAGKPSAERPDIYSDTSPAELLPFGAEQVSIHGTLDPIAPARVGEAYTAKAKAAGDPASFIAVPDAGHFEVIAVEAEGWKTVAGKIEALLRR